MAKKQKPPATLPLPLASSATAPVYESSRQDTGPPNAASSSDNQPPDDANTDQAATSSSNVRPTTTQSSSWNPLARYWSGGNIAPEYGTPQQSTVGSLKKGIMNRINKISGAFVPVNTLNSRASPPETPTTITTTKRLNESHFSKPSKRARLVADSPQTFVSSDGSECLEDMEVTSTPTPQKKLAQSGVISLPSSADRHSSHGHEQQEYRKTAHNSGLGKQKQRPRHHKKVHNDASNNLPGQDHNVRSNSQMSLDFRRPATARLLLSQQAANSSDEITELNDADFSMATSAAVHMSRPRPNGTNRTQAYTTAAFHVEDDSLSEDELAQQQPQVRRKQKDNRVKFLAPASSSFSYGTKRTAESIEESQSDQQRKRHQERSSSMSTSRTRPISNGNTAASRNVVTRLRLNSAFCEPKFIYPANRGMSRDLPGATEKKHCFIVPLRKGTKIDGFSAVDDDGDPIPQLEWLTPKPDKILKIWANLKDRFIWLNKRVDSTSQFAGGASLFLEFTKADDAQHFAAWCHEARPAIQQGSKYEGDMEKLMAEAIKNVTKTLKPGRTEQKSNRSPQDDLKLLERIDGMRNKTQPQNQAAGRFRKAKALRTQMRAEDDGDGRQTTSNATSRGLMPQTPGEIRQILDLLDNNDDDHSREFRLSRTRGKSPSDADGQAATPQSQRTLRSAKAKERSPSPDIERWSENNINWVEEHNWKMPLVYERTTVDAADVLRLDEGQFLNDEIISFYAKYLHKQLEQRDADLAKKIYVFNSFFFEKLKGNGYDGVKSWTAKVDLLSHNYIVVPINQAAHWYVAIICNPRGLLPHEDTQAEETARLQNEETITTQGQNCQDVNAKAETDAQMAAVISDLVQTESRDQLDGATTVNLEEATQVSNAKKSRAKRGPGRKKYDPKEPRVIILDSLDGSHPGVASALKMYLIKEIKQTTGVDIEAPTSFGMAAKDIPFQPNWTDCGVFLLGYLEEFMKDPFKFTSNILQHEGRDWDVDAPALRSKIRDLILKLQKEHQKSEVRRKRERLLSKKDKSRPSSAEAGSSSRVASEQLRSSQPPPSSASPAPSSRHQTPAPAPTSSVEHSIGGQQLREPVPRSSVSPAPLREGQASSSSTAAGSKQSQHDKRDDPSINVSMVVNPNDSVEMPGDQDTVTLETTPRVVRSVEQTGRDRTDTPGRNSSKTSITTPQHSPKMMQPAGNGEYDERRFLRPITSSPSRTSSRRTMEPNESSVSKPPMAKRVTPVQNETKSRFFSQKAVKPIQATQTLVQQTTPRRTAGQGSNYNSSALRSTRTKNPTRLDGAPEYTILSDDERNEGRRRSSRSGSKPEAMDTIDLTDEA